jgi:hypothetical protein
VRNYSGDERTYEKSKEDVLHAFPHKHHWVTLPGAQVAGAQDQQLLHKACTHPLHGRSNSFYGRNMSFKRIGRPHKFGWHSISYSREGRLQGRCLQPPEASVFVITILASKLTTFACTVHELKRKLFCKQCKAALMSIQKCLWTGV